MTPAEISSRSPPSDAARAEARAPQICCDAHFTESEGDDARTSAWAAVKRNNVTIDPVEEAMSTSASDGPVIIFDVLGTLVDQAGSLHRHVREATGYDDAGVARIVAEWLGYVAERERAIVSGRSTFVPSDVLDAEALERMTAAGVLPARALEPLADASLRLDPWPDTIDALHQFAAEATVMGLSNASRRVLTGLSVHAGLRWHQFLSGEDATTYKPDPRIYRAAIAAVPDEDVPPYLVAAHAWDLRAAAEAGMRTAYVPRPNGDPPMPDDSFDVSAENLGDLHRKLFG
ncbi:hypothetical protein GCM10010915_11560 [Microbacterium faecale]|uniref:Haloacid dehalogenase type II n=2 Tax=Microbacterium faecale TaxID=1804630 RepID=A0A917DE46_9MICO|nr:hypothetical protein GCM10010915_11560 [Microbacterium faecale]